MHSESTHRDERHRFIPFIAGGAGGVQVKRRLAIHQKTVLVMAMRQPHLNKPPAILPLVHQNGVPVVEIARQLNSFCPARGAIEIDRLDGIICGIDSVAGLVMHGVHKKEFLLDAFLPFVIRSHFGSSVTGQDSSGRLAGKGKATAG